jgi:AcrR family transcriptional regulator
MAKDPQASVNRRTEIVSAAIETFAEIGYYRATTAQVAARAQISQPYIFRFFSTKEALLLAALEVSWERILHAFRRVTEIASAERLEPELIRAYEEILTSHRNETLLQMQAQTIQEESIREAMRSGFRQVRLLVLESFEQAGIANAEERTFMFLARGMLCNISLALDLPELRKP